MNQLSYINIVFPWWCPSYFYSFFYSCKYNIILFEVIQLVHLLVIHDLPVSYSILLLTLYLSNRKRPCYHAK